MRHHLVNGNAAVADCRKEIIGTVEALTLSDLKDELVKLLIVEPYEIALELTLNLHLALKDIFLSALLLKP